MTKPVLVRGVSIGEGAPKIIVSLMARTLDEAASEAALYQSADFDILEWRADYFEGDDFRPFHGVLRTLREAFPEKPILFTFRTKKEGGQRDLSQEAYGILNGYVAWTGLADLVDVELSTGILGIVPAMVHYAQDHGLKVVVSSHDFEGTPPREEMLWRLRKMREYGADIPKLAVMPRTKRDVLNLLDVTLEMSETSDCPIITMAMGKEGVVSRLSGEVFGSAATFGSVQRASAPGQVAAGELRKILDVLHRG